ncbi:MAG: hypothetical protein ACRD1T_01160 [Acidimicrobiia bacterium]
MAASPTFERRLTYRKAVRTIRSGPLAGRWLFAWVFLAQLGHLLEHISVAIQGKALLGAQFDSELSHLLFNGAIAVLSIVLVLVYPRNPWVYPLVVLSIFHGIEHVYIYRQFLETGVTNGPGLLGRGGAIGLIPLERLDLHNVYNGLEVILMVLGFWQEADEYLEDAERASGGAR